MDGTKNLRENVSASLSELPGSLSQPIFIVGLPRSGTTLLRSMLCAHSRLTVPPESHFFNYWLREYGQLDLSNPADFETFWEIFSRSQRFGYFGLEAEPLRGEILQQSELSLKTVFRCWMDAFATKMGKPRWGEKTPIHYEHLATIFDWFPNAQIIWMLRDPRATSASLMKVGWASNYAYLNAGWWAGCLRSYEETWAKDKRVQLLRYEDLVATPEETLRSLCAFLNEPYESAMLKERDANTMPVNHRSGWAKAHLQTALAPVNQGSVEKWRSQLSSTQVAMIEKFTRESMVRHGYKPDTSGQMTPWQSVVFALTQKRHRADQKWSEIAQKLPNFRSLDDRWIGTGK